MFKMIADIANSMISEILLLLQLISSMQENVIQ